MSDLLPPTPSSLINTGRATDVALSPLSARPRFTAKATQSHGIRSYFQSHGTAPRMSLAAKIHMLAPCDVCPPPLVCNPTSAPGSASPAQPSHHGPPWATAPSPELDAAACAVTQRDETALICAVLSTWHDSSNTTPSHSTTSESFTPDERPSHSCTHDSRTRHSGRWIKLVLT